MRGNRYARQCFEIGQKQMHDFQTNMTDILQALFSLVAGCCSFAEDYSSAEIENFLIIMQLTISSCRTFTAQCEPAFSLKRNNTNLFRVLRLGIRQVFSGQPRPLFVYFRSFQTNIITIFTTNICEKCPSSIQCRDLNPRPLECEPLPITTRPGSQIRHFKQLIDKFKFKFKVYLCNG